MTGLAVIGTTIAVLVANAFVWLWLYPSILRWLGWF